MGGLPKDIASNEEVLEFFEPIFRADFMAVEQYGYEQMAEPFSVPIHVMAGLGEIDITLKKLETWQHETLFPLEKQFVDGNHFFIFEHACEVVQHVVKTYNDGFSKKVRVE